MKTDACTGCSCRPAVETPQCWPSNCRVGSVCSVRRHSPQARPQSDPKPHPKATRLWPPRLHPPRRRANGLPPAAADVAGHHQCSPSAWKGRPGVHRVHPGPDGRLPAKPLLEVAGLADEVEIEAAPGVLTIRPSVQPRAGWAEAASSFQPEGLIDEMSSTRFDDEEWYW